MNKNSIYSKLSEKYQNELITNLKKFVNINAVYDESTRDKKNPFGVGVTNALNFITDLARKDGFEVTNYNNMIVEILAGKGDKNITILAHADVVPAGDTGWNQDPFALKEEDGVLYGRGVADDKGPLLASYYAMRLIVDNNLQGDYQIRFLVGGNEESGSLGVQYYFDNLKKPQPTFGFSPDAEYPLIFAEKGITNFKVSGEFIVPDVISIHGGVASNSVIEKCVVKIKSASPFIQFVKEKNSNVIIEKGDDVTEISFIGKSAHGATPEEGENAGMVAIDALGNYFKDENLNKICALFSDLYGAGCDAYAKSDDMGKCSLNVGLLDYEDGKFSMVVNYRHVDTVTSEEMIEKITKASKPYEITVLSSMPVLYYPKDSILVSTLLSVYQEETGDYKSQPKAIGGGTYAKELENVVAFGMEFPGWNSQMHSPGECTKKEDLFKSIAIYARAIADLGKKIDEN